MGSVFDESFRSVTEKKLSFLVSRSPVCKTCNHDPINRLTEALKAVDEGHAEPGSRDEMIDSILADNQYIHGVLDKLEARIPKHPPAPSRPRLPLRVE